MVACVAYAPVAAYGLTGAQLRCLKDRLGGLFRGPNCATPVPSSCSKATSPPGIVELTDNDLTTSESGTHLPLAAHPVLLPPVLGQLVTRFAAQNDLDSTFVRASMRVTIERAPPVPIHAALRPSHCGHGAALWAWGAEE